MSVEIFIYAFYLWKVLSIACGVGLLMKFGLTLLLYSVIWLPDIRKLNNIPWERTDLLISNLVTFLRDNSATMVHITIVKKMGPGKHEGFRTLDSFKTTVFHSWPLQSNYSILDTDLLVDSALMRAASASEQETSWYLKLSLFVDSSGKASVGRMDIFYRNVSTMGTSARRLQSEENEWRAPSQPVSLSLSLSVLFVGIAMAINVAIREIQRASATLDFESELPVTTGHEQRTGSSAIFE